MTTETQSINVKSLKACSNKTLFKKWRVTFHKSLFPISFIFVK